MDATWEEHALIEGEEVAGQAYREIDAGSSAEPSQPVKPARPDMMRLRQKSLLLVGWRGLGGGVKDEVDKVALAIVIVPTLTTDFKAINLVAVLVIAAVGFFGLFKRWEATMPDDRNRAEHDRLPRRPLHLGVE